VGDIKEGLKYLEIENLSHLLLQRRSKKAPFNNKNWRESYYFNTTDEKKQLSLITTIGILPNKKRSSGFVIIIHKGKIALAKLLITRDIKWHESDRFGIAGLSYRLEGIDWRLRYRSKGCNFDMLFRPVNEFYSYNKKNNQGNYGNSRMLFSQHIGEESAFNLWKGSSQGKPFQSGYYFNSERNLKILSSEIKGQGISKMGEPKGSEIKFTDEEGMRHNVKCQVMCSVPIPLPGSIVYETIARMKLDNDIGFGLLERHVHDSNPLHKVRTLAALQKKRRGSG
jgi:hypothetical protein